MSPFDRDRAPLCCKCDTHEAITDGDLCLECALVMLAEEDRVAEAKALGVEHGMLLGTVLRVVKRVQRQRERSEAAAMEAALRPRQVA